MIQSLQSITTLNGLLTDMCVYFITYQAIKGLTMYYVVFQTVIEAGNVYKLKEKAIHLMIKFEGKYGSLGYIETKRGRMHIYDDVSKARIHADIVAFSVGCGG